MQKITDTGKRIIASGIRSQYDIEAINLLSDKQFLSRILKDCVQEFAEMDYDRIAACIDNPSVGVIPVSPGLTNSVIMSASKESKIINEGVVTYDICFAAYIPNERKIQLRLIIDVEVQLKEKPGYDIVSRAILYTGRMLSAQMGQNVIDNNYDALDKVYSIWICMNCAVKRAYTISRYFINHDAVHGQILDTARSDLLQVIMIRLPKENRKNEPVNEPTELMKLLSTLFSKNKTAEEKLLELQKYGIIVSEEIKEGVNTMCNLSQGIYEEGLTNGRKEGRTSLIINMLKNGMTPQQICEISGVSAEEVEEISKNTLQPVI